MEKAKPGRPSNNSNRRNEILQKAATCFATKGYNETTLDEIGETLGFNKAALYYYFKNKEDLFGHVTNYEMQRQWSQTIKLTEAERGIEKKLIRYFDIRCDVVVGIITTTNLSKHNMINLNEPHIAANEKFRKQQLEFLKSLMLKVKTNHTQTEITDFLNLLTGVLSSLTMSTLLLNGPDSKQINIDTLKKTRKQVVQYFLNSFLNNYVPV